MATENVVPPAEPASGTQHRQYAQNVLRRAMVTMQKSIFSESYLYNFAEFLNTPSHQTTEAQPPRSAHCIVVDFHNPTGTRVINTLHDLEDLAAQTGNGRNPAFLLFLQGQSSSEWLNAIGDLFELDVNFFHRHSPVRSLDSLQSSYTYPTLPSTSIVMPRLRTHTIARLPASSHQDLILTEAWQSHAASWRHYVEDVRDGRDREISTSIIRNSTLHDLETLSMDQDLTIYVKALRDGWAGFVWTDVGSDLGDIIDESWFGRKASNASDHVISTLATTLQPFASRKVPEGASVRKRRIPQTAMHLAQQYVALVDCELASKDSFYAIEGLLAFTAQSKLSFLNMLEVQIEAAFTEAMKLDNNNIGLLRLLQNQRLLLRCRQDIAEAHDMIERRQDRVWPSSTDMTLEQSNASAASASKLSVDLAYLQQRARLLSSRCDNCLQNVMSAADIAESKKAIQQAERVEKLTALATVFIPLSFTCSFFGMNFQQLGQGELSIWIWFAVSLPIMAITIVIVNKTIRTIAAMAVGRVRNMASRKSKHDEKIASLEMEDIA